MKNTETEKNLLLSFAGESQARNRYTYYSQAAQKEGYIQIAEVFEKTANQESVHAKMFFDFLEGNEIEITGSFLAGKIGTTEENLETAACGEHYEHKNLYPKFAKIAQKEGFNDVASVFKFAAIAEKHHEKRYRSLLNSIKENSVSRKNEPVVWCCIKCGYTHTGREAPNKCPLCKEEQKYFKMLICEAHQ